MEQINEVELWNMARKMNGKSVQVKISGILYIYNREKGIMLSMDVFMAYMLKSSENRQIIEVRMENDEVITLHIV